MVLNGLCVYVRTLMDQSKKSVYQYPCKSTVVLMCGCVENKNSKRKYKKEFCGIYYLEVLGLILGESEQLRVLLK